MSVSPPTPIHHIRAHKQSVTTLSISDDNERIYSADTSGFVVCTSSRSLRPLAAWHAHTDSILGVQESGDRVFTHGRDNKLHIWRRPKRGAPIQVGTSATAPGLVTPECIDTMDVNSLNYCRFSLLQDAGDDSDELWLAVPNLIESACADIWRLPGKERLHAAIGKPEPFKPMPMDGRGGGVRNATGIIMSMHLLPSLDDGYPRLLTAFENGAVKLWTYDPHKNEGRATSVEGIGWEPVWEVKVHVESVMGMAVSRDGSLAFSVSADHLIGKYIVAELGGTQNKPEPFRSKHPGNSAIALRDDVKVCAIGGWDGKLYSTKSFKLLGILQYHQEAVQGLCFAHTIERTFRDAEEEDEDEDGYILTSQENEARGRWLISAGKDGRVAVWELIDFAGRRTE